MTCYRMKKRTQEVKKLVDVISESNLEIEELRRELENRDTEIDGIGSRLDCTARELDEVLIERKKLLKDVMQLTTDLSESKSQRESLTKNITELEIYKDKAEELSGMVENLGKTSVINQEI